MGGSTQESDKWEYTLDEVIVQRNVTLRKSLKKDGEIRQFLRSRQVFYWPL